MSAFSHDLESIIKRSLNAHFKTKWLSLKIFYNYVWVTMSTPGHLHLCSNSNATMSKERTNYFFNEWTFTKCSHGWPFLRQSVADKILCVTKYALTVVAFLVNCKFFPGCSRFQTPFNGYFFTFTFLFFSFSLPKMTDNLSAKCETLVYIFFSNLVWNYVLKYPYISYKEWQSTKPYNMICSLSEVPI